MIEKVRINIKYSFEKRALGAGGAIRNAKDYLENEFLLSYRDTFLDINYNNLINHFHEKTKLGVIVVFKDKSRVLQNNMKINNKEDVTTYNERGENAVNFYF